MLNSSYAVTKILFIFISAMVLAAIINNFITFYYQKNNLFIVEAFCDPASELCFVRSCDDVECPPSGLEIYKEYAIKARDFEGCADDFCSNLCLNDERVCKPIKCVESAGDSCLGISE